MDYTRENALQSISTGTLNPRMLGKFFMDMKLKSFTYDYVMQRELGNVIYKKLKINSGRSYMMKWVYSNTMNRVMEYTIPITFITDNKRELYKRSDLKGRFLDWPTMEKNKRYFRYSVIVSINGRLFMDYRIKAEPERITIVFEQRKFPKDAEDMIVQFIPDALITMHENPYPGLFTNGKIDADVLHPVLPFHTIRKYIGYWIDKETNKGYMIPNITYDPENRQFEFHDQLPADLSKLQLMIVGIMNLQEIVDFPTGTEWVQMRLHYMPLPKDNIIVLIQKENMYEFNDGSVTLTEYYPNIYHIDNPNGYPIRMIELYEDNSQNEHIVYDNEVARYMVEIDIEEEYRNGTIPQDLKEFKPVDWLYGLDDYLEKNPYKELDLRDKWKPFLYKMNTLSKMLKNWFLLYEEYMKRTFGFLGGWYHVISHYDNMNDKIRMSSAVDVENNPNYIQHFTEAQYVFSYMHNSMMGDANSFCFFIDGKYTIPTKIIIYQGIQYVYFPKRLINDNSIIEVERFDGNVFAYKLNLTGLNARNSSNMIQLQITSLS